MARINLDDTIESKDEFWDLMPLIGNDRDKALGMLVRFFRIAQDFFSKGLAIPKEVLEEKGLGSMIASKWAIPIDGGFQVKGADKHFAWYVQKIGASSAGGRARSSAPRDAKGRLLPNSPAGVQPVPAGVQPEQTRDQPTSSPPALALAPALAPALAKKKEEEQKIEIGEIISVWMETLKVMGINRAMIPHEQVQLARMVKAHGLEAAKLACVGARHEPKFSGYDPTKNVSLTRLEDPKQFQKFLNWGGQNKRAPGAEKEKSYEETMRQLKEEKYATDEN